MTFLSPWISVVLAIRFSLDAYTNWWNSPSAATLFWACFVAVMLVIVLTTLWVFRRMRPH